MEKRLLGNTGFFCFPVGFGGYRIADGDPEQRQALLDALLGGCNLLDTSTNYMDGRSEQLIGSIIQELTTTGVRRREDIFVVTKAGYVQGKNLSLAQARKQAGQPFEDMVEYQASCWHCISPDFLEDQITRSCERMQMPQLDALLLHNPEYFLKAGGSHSDYYARIEKAFRFLESEVARGRIRFYGVSSNTLGHPRESDEYTSLETLIEIAEKISARHHFSLIQLPFNLYEPGGAFENNNSGKSALELAQLKKIGVLINRPLNAYAANRLVRLASFPTQANFDPIEKFQAALSAAMSMEAKLPTSLRGTPGLQAWAHIIRENLKKLMELDTWKSVCNYQINPSLKKIRSTVLDAESTSWLNSYLETMNQMTLAFTVFLETRAGLVSRSIEEAINRAVPELKSSPTLSSKAIRIYRSIPGIDCVLVGMRERKYVLDSLALLPAISPEAALDAIEAVPLDWAEHAPEQSEES